MIQELGYGSSIQDIGYRSLTVGSRLQELGCRSSDTATGKLAIGYTQKLRYRSLDRIQKLRCRSLVHERGYRMVG